MAQPQITGNKTKALRIGQRLMTGAKSFGEGIKNSVDTSKQVISQSARKIKADQKKINMENKKQQRFEDAVKEETERRQKGMFSGGYKLADTTKKMVEKVAVDPLKALWNIVLAWALKNLPKIIEEVRKFIKKTRIVMAAINNAFKATGNLFKGWLNYGKTWLSNMLSFDWNDSQGKLEEAQKEIDDARGELDASWDTMYNVWGKEEDELDKMLAFLDDGKTVKQTVDAITSGAPMPQTPVVGPGADNSGASPSSDGGFKGDANNYGMSQDAVTNTKWKPILNLIASAESIDGSYSSAYQPGGNSKIIPGLENMSIREAVEASGGAAADGRHYAIGRYQFTTLTAGQAARAGLSVDDKFSPENQDKMAIALIEGKKGVTFDMLRNNPAQAQMLLAQEWAGLPKDRTNQSYYGGDGINAAHKDTTAVRGAFQSALDGGVSTGGDTATPSGTISGGATSSGSTLQRGDQVSGYTISSAFGMRMHPTLGRMKGHGGLDIACPQGTYLAVSVDVEIVYASPSHGGYGGLIDAWAPSLGVQFRFAHMNVIMCSPGQKVRAGTAIGRSGGRPGTQGAGTSTGPHVHYEISTQRNDATYGGSQSPQLLAKYAKYIILSSRKPTTTLNGSNTSSTAPAAATDLSSTAASNRTNGRQQNNHTTLITQIERIFTN